MISSISVLLSTVNAFVVAFPAITCSSFISEISPRSLFVAPQFFVIVVDICFLLADVLTLTAASSVASDIEVSVQSLFMVITAAVVSISQ